MRNTADSAAVRAGEKHVVVVGGGIAGLTVALECAKVGLAVTVLEAGDHLGGTVRATEVAGLRLDAVVEGWRTGGGSVRALATDLGLGAEIAPAADGDVWIDPGDGPAAPLPRRTLAGIPENPWDEGVRRIIGWRGTWRAYLDRVRPPLTIGQERSLGKLVRSRMGDAVLDRMVAPLSLGAYGIHPDDVDVEAVAPGLSTALTRMGSLSGGVSQLLIDDPGPGVEGLAGGTFLLVDALRARLADLGADLRTDTRVDRLERGVDGRWEIGVLSGTDAATAAPRAAAPADQTTDDPSAASAPPVRPADAVVVAVPDAEARRLLAGVVPALDGPVRPVGATEVVTLVVHEPALDAHPRGRAVYPVAGSRRAAAVSDSTARWPWLAAAAPDLHVLRVAFGTAAHPAATAELDDAAALALARDEASALLGVPLADLRGAVRERFTPPTPASTLGHDAAASAARGAIRAVAGLGAAGAWLAGSGLAPVIADAVEEAERVRRAVLWGPDGR
ncbi:protoporphyrinogen/coproporphyrinogen oxidase [Microbacterium sp. P5_E9]